MDNQNYSEAATIGMKILGVLVAIITFRWMAKIFAGPDGKFSITEFGRMTGTLFFLFWGGYMLYTEGHRSHEWHLYSEWYIAIVFGSMLTTLHLDHALDKVYKIMQAMVDMRRKTPKPDDTE